jgi:hypothetical protein
MKLLFWHLNFIHLIITIANDLLLNWEITFKFFFEGNIINALHIHFSF